MRSEDVFDHPAVGFLGKEFLLWLWWTSETRYGSVEIEPYGVVDFWIDDRLQFRSGGDQPQVSDLRGGAPATTGEAKMALASGKTVAAARIGIRLGEREYSLELREEGLEFAGLKVPSEVKDGIDERIYERMFLLEEASSVIGALFHRFCERRMHPSWSTHVVPELRAWIAG